MNAETILKLIERALNPDLKQAHIKAYAQAMIEKDRERVDESFGDSEWYEKASRKMNETHIILD